jgi:multiple sugar transport system ATP-binding protein
MRGIGEAEVRHKVNEVARMLRIDDKLKSPATRLSGGQMQRVAIGRALVRSPALYLMDEPLSSLDAKLRNDLRLELKRIQQDLGATMLYVTHDQIEALTLATRIGVLDRGELVQVGTPQQIYEEPVSSHVAARLGSPRINLLPREALPALPAPPGTATVGVRAEHLGMHQAQDLELRSAPGSVSLRQADRHATAQVRRVEHLGDQYLVLLGLDGSEQELIGAAPPGSRHEPGDMVHVELQRPLWFDSAGRRIAA